MDWNSAPARLTVAGPILIVLGLVLYALRGNKAVLVFSVLGVILLTAGVIYKPNPKKVKISKITPSQLQRLGRSYA